MVLQLLAERIDRLTSEHFESPTDPNYDFDAFYAALKARRFVIYPGKVSDADTFRIGNIGHVFPNDMRELVENVSVVLSELGGQNIALIFSEFKG